MAASFDVSLHNLYSKKYKKTKKKFSYSSGNNDQFLKVSELKKIIQDYSKKNNV